MVFEFSIDSPTMTTPRKYDHMLRIAFLKHYSEGSDVWTNDPVMRSIVNYILPKKCNDHCSAALDIGCGAGHDLIKLSKHYHQVTGLDIYSHREWTKITTEYPNVNFVCQNFLSFCSPSKFCLILDNGCFHHQHPSQHSRYIAKINSLLKPGGMFALSTFVNPASIQWKDENGRLFNYFTDDEISKLLEKSGMAIQSQSYISKDLPSEHGNYYRISICTKRSLCEPD